MADVRGASTKVEGQTAATNALKGNPVLIGASDGSNIQNLLVDPSGNLRANHFDISGSIGSITTTGGTTAVTTNGGGIFAFNLTQSSGTTSNLIFQIEGTVEGTNWESVQFSQMVGATSGGNQIGGSLTSYTTTSLTTPISFVASAAGFKQMRVNITTISGGPTLTLNYLVQQAPLIVRPPAMATPARFVFTASTTNQTLTAPATGLRIYVVSLSGSNSGNSSTLVEFQNGTTAMYDFFMAAGGGGFSVNLIQPWALSAATALTIVNSVSTSSAYITINYFIAP